MNKHLVIGLGEIGTAVQKIFKADGIDRDQKAPQEKYDFIHICIPFNAAFNGFVKVYQKKYSPIYTVVHSTTPPGTCTSLQAVHSPVIGIHPHLEEGIRTFTKFLGGEKADIVGDEFRRNGLRVYVFDKAETTELMKILDTTFYGVCIEYTKDVKKLAKEWGVPFEAWTIWTNNYNEGYTKLNHPEYVRPNLVPIMKPKGGHCIMPNTELLDTKFTKFLRENDE